MMTWRWTDRVALGCFVMSLLLLLAFHLSPLFVEQRGVGSEEVTYGWMVWPAVVGDLVDFENIDVEIAGPSFALVLGVALALTSPFVIPTLSRNRVLWWFMLLASGLLVTGLTGILGSIMFRDDPLMGNDHLGVGYLWVMTFPLPHLMGVLFVRQRPVVTK
ncbi:hypothetical protein [Haloferula sp. A504]|uniref:hypothetical protein n=1 Tax=Haloferula sp. A504 TaxID=3373601 RepID=UPI0037C081ED